VESQLFGKRLKELRKKARLTQRELAQKVGIDFTYLSKLESGATPPPSEKVILELANVLNADRDELLTLAGKIPPDISQLFTKPAVIRLLRTIQRGQRMLTASNRKRRNLQTNSANFFKNYGKVARAGVAVFLALAVATSLWFAAPTPAKALTISFPTFPTSGTVGVSHTFEVEVKVEDSDLLPVQGVDLYIYKSDARTTYESHCDNLPLNTTTTAYTRTSAQTGSGTSGVGGAVSISATAQSTWGYGYGYRYGYGYTEPGGSGLHYFGYGYGYGYTTLVGTTWITYTVTWTVPASWPAGTYKVETKVKANTKYFTKLSDEFTLTAGGGGGAAGGAPPTRNVNVNMFGDKSSPEISRSGELLEKVKGTSEDGKLTIIIDGGTIIVDEDGDPLTKLTMTVNENPPSPPADTHIIGLAYDFEAEPSGVTFDPALTMTWEYSPPDVPDDVLEKNLVIVYYDEDEEKWVEMECEVNIRDNFITASISHFTNFAIIGHITPPPPPAAFSLTSLRVFPPEVDIGEAVSVSVMVANTGGQSGTYQVTFKINNVAEETEEVEIAAGSREEVTFTTAKNAAGTYAVNVNEMSSSFKVREKIAPPPPTPTPTPTPDEPQINWWLISGIIAGVAVIIGMIVTLVIRRQRGW